MDMKKQKTILIAEDEEEFRIILSDMLKKKGFSVREARNGKEALMLALSEHPDLLLLDLFMPEMSGIEALEKIREDAWGAHMPVIVLTVLSETSEELVQVMVNQRPVGYLIKSDCKISDVIKKVEEVLKD